MNLKVEKIVLFLRYSWWRVVLLIIVHMPLTYFYISFSTMMSTVSDNVLYLWMFYSGMLSFIYLRKVFYFALVFCALPLFLNEFDINYGQYTDLNVQVSQLSLSNYYFMYLAAFHGALVVPFFIFIKRFIYAQIKKYVKREFIKESMAIRFVIVAISIFITWYLLWPYPNQK